MRSGRTHPPASGIDSLDRLLWRHLGNHRRSDARPRHRLRAQPAERCPGWASLPTRPTSPPMSTGGRWPTVASFLELVGQPHAVEVRDVVERPPVDEADVALLLKLVTTLDRQVPGGRRPPACGASGPPRRGQLPEALAGRPRQGDGADLSQATRSARGGRGPRQRRCRGIGPERARLRADARWLIRCVTARGDAGRADLPARCDACRRARRQQRRPAPDRDRGRGGQRLPPPPPSRRARHPGGRRDPSVHGLGRTDPERLGWLPGLEPHPPGSEAWRHPRQRGHLPRAGDRGEVEPDARAGGRPPVPARQRHRRLPRRLHRCGRAGGGAGAIRRADGALGAGDAARSSTVRWPSGARRSRRGSSRSCRAAGRRCCGGSVPRSWRPSDSTGTASAAGRSRRTAPCWSIRCAGSPSRCRTRYPSTRSGSVAPTTSSTRSRSATRSSTVRCRPATHATGACTRSGPAGLRSGLHPATISTARSASTIRSTGSTTGRSRRGATARSARATRRPTCITCSRSATSPPSAWRRSTTFASTSACSSLLRRA